MVGGWFAERMKRGGGHLYGVRSLVEVKEGDHEWAVHVVALFQMGIDGGIRRGLA